MDYKNEGMIVMKNFFNGLAILAMVTTSTFLPTDAYALEKVGDPTYEAVGKIVEEELTNGYIYHFNNGTKDSDAGPLLMVDGEFTDAEVVLEDGRAFITGSIIERDLGCDVNFDINKGNVNIYKDETTIEMTVGELKAVLNGDTVSVDAAPIVTDEEVYLPLSFIATSLGKSVGFLPKGGRGFYYGFAFNPIVWVDDADKTEKAENSKDEVLEWLKSQLELGLNSLKNNLDTANRGLLKGISLDNPTFERIESDIKGAYYVGQVGRYIVFFPPYGTIVDTDTDTIYFRTTAHALVSLWKADMNNPDSFVPMYFAD